MSPVAARTSANTFYLCLYVTLLAREANTAPCVFSRSSAITIDPQPVTSKVDVVDKKTNLNVGARDSIPKLRVLSSQDKALPPSRPNVSAHGLPLGPVPLDNVSTSIVQSNAMAMEKIKGLRTAICKGITLPKRNLPAFDDFIAKGPLMKAEESMDKPATDMAKCHITLVQWGYAPTFVQLLSYVDAAERAHWLFGVT